MNRRRRTPPVYPKEPAGREPLVGVPGWLAKENLQYRIVGNCWQQFAKTFVLGDCNDVPFE